MVRPSIAVVGAGSWGTALACLLGRQGNNVTLWVYEEELVEQMHRHRENSLYLPGTHLPETIHPSHDLAEVLTGRDFIVWVTPSHTVRDTLTAARDFIQANAIFIGASKGIENQSLKRVSEIVEEVLGPDRPVRYLTLSGPTFAKDVASSHPTTAVVAGSNDAAGKFAQEVFNTNRFRVYYNEDHVGVELGGALKNVIAIAVGIAMGLGLGSNSRAAIITRGLWEITRLGHALGANPLTFLGLSGMGDLVLTCDGTQSRNFHVGRRIGQGESLDSIIKSMRMVAEGIKTTRSARELALKHHVEMPITEKVFEVLYTGKTPEAGLEELMSRSLKSEQQFNYLDI